MTMDLPADDPGIFARNFALHELLSQDGQKMSLVKLHQDKNRLIVKSIVESGHEIKFRIQTEQLLERSRFQYSHTLGVAQNAGQFSYQLLLEDKMEIQKIAFGTASNAFFRDHASTISDEGSKMALVSHFWTPEDNIGYDPFHNLFTIDFDVSHPEVLLYNKNLKKNEKNNK